MATYEEWNEDIARWFTRGLSRGSRVFLSVDEDVIEAIGRTLGVSRNAVDDFCRQVRRKVAAHGSVDVTPIAHSGRDEAPPPGVAFLAACVLAGSRMQNDEDQGIRETNFFLRLREVLGFPADPGRPPGLLTGEEEALWENWARWLRTQRLENTAHGGEGAWKYTLYPVSQTLLREAEKAKLVGVFESLRLGKDLDATTLLGRLSSVKLPIRLAAALDDERRAAVIDAMHDLYESWQHGEREVRVTSAAKLYAGLYRTVDFLGNVSYFIYPRAPRRLQTTVNRATRNGQAFALTSHRQGFIDPFVEATPRDLDEGTRFELDEGAGIVLPRRDYWVLVSDPEGLEHGVHASWGAPALGAPFVVLVRKSKMPELARLEVDGLIRYSRPQPAFSDRDDWYVLEDCLVISESSTRDFGRFGDLAELRPSSKLSISVTGGIRSPRGGDWMERHGPDVAIVSFEETALVKLMDLDTGETLREDEEKTGQVLDFDWPLEGRFRLVASAAGVEATREVRIVTWESLRLASDIAPLTRPISGAVLCGAAVSGGGTE